MTHVLNRPARRIRNTKGASYLTHGGDNYDHRGYNKAQRALGQALIQEALEDTEEPPEEPPEAIYKWVVTAWCVDGDKWWLDDFCPVGYFDTQEEAEELVCRIEDRFTHESWKAPFWEYRIVDPWEIS